MVNTQSLKKKWQFSRLYRKGNYFAGKYLVLYIIKNQKNINRLGITVSKKVGKSVKRNRIRRLIKENYRKYEFYIVKGHDIVFVARSYETMPDFYSIKKEMLFLFKKAGIYSKEINNA